MKLHLGCWTRYIPGFVHVDLCDLPHIDYCHRVDQLPMFADGAAELVYASHVFEYFDRIEARSVLAEWRRVLKTGGTLRVAVPDFPALIEVYRRSGSLDRILGPLYGRMQVEGTDTVIYHRTVYDFASMKALLEQCGFENVHVYDWRDTIHRDIDDHSQAYYPHMDKERGLLVSLNVEATRP